MVSSRSIAQAAVLSALVLGVSAGDHASLAAAKRDPLSALENADLVDLLDAEVDESFLHSFEARGLQSRSQAPTPSPTTTDRNMVTEMPTSAPTSASRAMEGTMAPTSSMASSAPTAAGSPGMTDSEPDAEDASSAWKRTASAVTVGSVIAMSMLWSALLA